MKFMQTILLLSVVASLNVAHAITNASGSNKKGVGESRPCTSTPPYARDAKTGAQPAAKPGTDTSGSKAKS